jgi:hypothetical protein
MVSKKETNVQFSWSDVDGEVREKERESYGLAATRKRDVDQS